MEPLAFFGTSVFLTSWCEDHRRTRYLARAPAQTTVRRFRVARLDLRSPQGEQRFEHLKRVYD